VLEELMERKIHLFESVSSTQTVARNLFASGVAHIGEIILADTQTAGRGRFGRRWISPSGGIYGTLICPPDSLVAMKAGMSVVRVLRAAGVPAEIKWPNDILVDGLKMAGLLIERDEIRALVGIGVNVTSSPLPTSTYLSLYASPGDRTAWIRRIADNLFEGIEERFDLNEYRQVCNTLGQHVRIEWPGHRPPLEGIATAIATAGQLVVQTDKGSVAVSSGECLHVRPVIADA
jgi:BirA family biotin operon repressor/biotin-[acetyl-CoA-carboxylase] ligase